MSGVTQPVPPRNDLLAYRYLGLRLPQEYRPWVAADVADKRFLTHRIVRTLLWEAVLLGLWAVGHHAGRGEWPAKLSVIRFGLVMLAYALFSSRDALVKRTLQWQRIDRNGAPVARLKRMGLFEQKEAALLAVAALVLWTGGAYVGGYGLRPTGIAAIPCREASPATLDRIKAGFVKDQDITFVTTRTVPYPGGEIVVGIVNTPKRGTDKKQAFEGWLVTGEGIARLGGTEPVTTFAEAERADRAAGPALKRAVECLEKKPKR